MSSKFIKHRRDIHRVVVTGISIVSPIGVTKEESFTNLLAGKSGIVSLSTDPKFKGINSQVGGKLPKLYYDEIAPNYKTSFGDAPIFTLANYLTQQALNDAKFNKCDFDMNRCGIMIGT